MISDDSGKQGDMMILYKLHKVNKTILHIWLDAILWCKDVCHNFVLLQISMENIKAVDMEGFQQFALFVWTHKHNKSFFIVWIIFKQPA